MAQRTPYEHAARGAFSVHTCPRPLVGEVEWALANEIGEVVKLRWSPVHTSESGEELYRAECEWVGPVGTAARVASSLFGWRHLRFEITEHQAEGGDAGRWMHTPELGIFHSAIDASGNTLLSENMIRTIIANTSGGHADLATQLRAALGDVWDAELEPYRAAALDEPTIFDLPRRSAG